MASDILGVQDYLYYGLLSCDLFNRFNVVQAREFLMASELEFNAIWQTPRKGQTVKGAGLYVEMPKLDIPKPNSLQRNLVVGIVAIEERNMNMVAGVGTVTSAEELAEMALDFMFGWIMGFSSGLTPEQGTVRPAPDVMQGDAADGMVLYRASVSLRREHRAIGRCDSPVIATADDVNYTLTNGVNTPDAVIYYTLDQSFPGKANNQASVFTTAIPLAPGQIITCAAWRGDLLPSHVQTKIIK